MNCFAWILAELPDRAIDCDRLCIAIWALDAWSYDQRAPIPSR